MTQDGHAHIVFGILLSHPVGIVHSTTLGTLTHNDDTAGLTLADTTTDEVLQLVGTRAVLRDDGRLGSRCNGTVLSQETSITSHHLNKEDTLMTGGRITYLVHTLHDGVQCGVISYGTVRTIQVIVDGTRQTDTGNIKLIGKDTSTGERTVTTYHHQGIDATLLHVLIRTLTTLGGLKLPAACRLQYRTSSLDDITHILRGEFHNLVVDKALVSTIDGHHSEVICYGCTCHSTNGCIHARSISAAGQYPDTINLSHSSILHLLCV